MVEIGITMAVKAPVKTVAALTALKALQEDAKRKGLDKMTMDEINAEIAAYRCALWHRQSDPHAER
jgi:hypothetical protein